MSPLPFPQAGQAQGAEAGPHETLDAAVDRGEQPAHLALASLAEPNSQPLPVFDAIADDLARRQCATR